MTQDITTCKGRRQPAARRHQKVPDSRSKLTQLITIPLLGLTIAHLLSLIAPLDISLQLVSCQTTSTTNGANSAGAPGSCHLRELDLCAASLLVFTQAPNGLATTDNEINKQCVHLKDAEGCMRSYTRRCMTPIQREITNLAANSSFQLLDEYCTKGSKLRSNYLKHSQCLNQIQKKHEHKSCLRDLQASLELLTVNQMPVAPKNELQKPESSSPADGVQSQMRGKRLQLACCAYRRFETCLGVQMEKRCGKETIQFVSSLIRRATSRLPETLCRHFKPDGQECRALLPKFGTSPKGPKSNSIVSRILSAYSGL